MNFHRAAKISTILKWLHLAIFVCGCASLLVAGLIIVQERVYQHVAARRFETAVKTPGHALKPDVPDNRLSSPVKVTGSSPGTPPEPLGKIEIPRLNFSVMFFSGTEESVLKLGPGQIEGTVLPGQIGNAGIAAHRDTHFRPLKDLRAGDRIRVTMANGVFNYSAKSFRIVDQDATYLLNSTPQPTLTLVTCYPFYFIGNAPKRYVIQAVALNPKSFVGGYQNPVAEKEKVAEDSIKLKTDLVILHATVKDGKGRAVPDLEQNNFKIFDNGIEQPLSLFSREDVPISVGIVIDDSGSMAGKRESAIASGLAFTGQRQVKDEIFVVTFNDRAQLTLPPDKPFTSNPKELERALSVLRPLGRTALYDAMTLALNHLKKAGNRKKVIILISDGGDNASRRRLQEVIRMAQESDALIYSIGIFDEMAEDKNPGVLRDLARLSGGEAYFPANPKEIIQVCERIAAEIREQYVLGYGLQDHASTGYHKLNIQAQHPKWAKLQIRSRPGFTKSQ